MPSLRQPRIKFGRLFPNLPAWDPDIPIEDAHQQIANLMYHDLPNAAKHTPAGYTYLGQFIGHDISFDPTAINKKMIANSSSIANFRIPAFNLNSIYGDGPFINPYLYRASKADWRSAQFIIGEAETKYKGRRQRVYDLPRIKISQDKKNTAIISDLRNDEHILISQLHLAFLLFHNKVVTDLAKEEKNPILLFQRAQQIVRWHFQWIIWNDYLPRIIEEKTLKQLATEGRKYYSWQNEPFMPLAFSAAAFRFGHSQVRENYKFNEDKPNSELLQPYQGPFTVVEWKRFFPEGGNTSSPKLNRSQVIGPHLSAGLRKLPAVVFPAHDQGHKENNLARRNLDRGYQLGLPSGQSLALAMNIQPLTIGKDIEGFPKSLVDNTPLWYYILYESKAIHKGKKLGPLGGLVVAEVIHGILEGDKESFFHQPPHWRPTISLNNEFTMADLLSHAGVFNNSLVTV